MITCTLNTPDNATLTAQSPAEFGAFELWSVFREWLEAFDHEHMLLRGIEVQSVDVVGKNPPKVLFAKAKMDILDRATGKPIPGIVFFRGGAVCVLLFLVEKQRRTRYIVTVQQPRVPLGAYRYREVVAGMHNDATGIAGQMVNELREETGVILAKEDLVPLGTMVPSAGGCDEVISCFIAEKEIDEATLAAMLARTHGEGDESIRVQVMTPAEFVAHIARGDAIDGKMLAALSLYAAHHSPGALVALLNQKLS